MSTKAKWIALGAASALALVAPAAAQSFDPRALSDNANNGATITDLEIADTPISFLRDQALTDALAKAARVDLVTGDRTQKSDVDAAVTTAFATRADTIIGAFNLSAIPQLSFITEGNKTAAEQDGNRNRAEFDQVASRGGWAIVNQRGEDNSTSITQADTRAAGQPSLNRAYVGQVGFSAASGRAAYSNVAQVVQTHRSYDITPAAFNGLNLANNATIQQGGFRDLQFLNGVAVASRSNARIEQEGYGNDAVIQQGLVSPNTWAAETGIQVGQDNFAILNQRGGANRAVILQEDGANALVAQYGFGNAAFSRQDGDVMDSGQYSVIEQGSLERDGNDNFASVFQRGMMQESSIYQRSNNNIATVYQTVEAAYAKSAIEQRGGDGNYANVVQSASSISDRDAVISSILQDGSQNEAFVSQTVAAGSRSVISQTGDRNFALVRQ